MLFNRALLSSLCIATWAWMKCQQKKRNSGDSSAILLKIWYPPLTCNETLILLFVQNALVRQGVVGRGEQRRDLQTKALMRNLGTRFECRQRTCKNWCTFRIFFWGGWQAVSLVFKPPSLPQIFSVISDTSCHTLYLFFKLCHPSPNNLC